MSRPAANRTRRSGTIRCAIYTRKSSEEGLEQEFNSLQAQREACEAFIKSQRHEGWVCLPDGYDDGGLSGATQRMLSRAILPLRNYDQCAVAESTHAHDVLGVEAILESPNRIPRPSPA